MIFSFPKAAKWESHSISVSEVWEAFYDHEGGVGLRLDATSGIIPKYWLEIQGNKINQSEASWSSGGPL